MNFFADLYTVQWERVGVDEAVCVLGRRSLAKPRKRAVAIQGTHNENIPVQMQCAYKGVV